MTTLLNVTWSVSKGRDTYGYNICRLDDTDTGKRFRCMGGGYDMVGTVFGDWLENRYRDRLDALLSRDLDLYGLSTYKTGGARLDGACGISSMRNIATALGLRVEWRGNRKGDTVAFLVTETKEA